MAFDHVLEREELQKKLELERLKEVEEDKIKAEEEDHEEDAFEQTVSQQPTQNKRRKRNTGKKQDAEEVMNSFMRKLHGEDANEDANKKSQAAKGDLNKKSNGQNQQRGSNKITQGAVDQDRRQQNRSLA